MLKDFMNEEAMPNEDGLRHIGGEVMLLYQDDKSPRSPEERKAETNCDVVDRLSSLRQVRKIYRVLPNKCL